MIDIAYYKSPIGVLRIFSTQSALQKIELAKEYCDFECSSFNSKVIEQLKAYFDGDLQVFTLPVVFPYATEFQKNVYAELSKVEYGKTKSYKELAEDAGSPNASRAVGSAMAKNPIPLVVPCHRIINSSGKTGQYSLGGNDKKVFLLDFEKSHS